MFTTYRDSVKKLSALDVSQATIEFDMDGNILTANQNFLNTMGYSLKEIRGRHHSMFADAEYVQSQAYKDFWDALRHGDYQAAQYKRFGKGGKEIRIEASYNPLLDARRKPYKVVKFATDITKQKMHDLDCQGQLDSISK